MGSVREWLPDGAFGLETARRAFGEAVRTWSHRWFGGDSVEFASCDFPNAGPTPSISGPDSMASPDSISIEGHVGAISLPPRSKRVLLEAALSVDLSEVSLSDADRSVLDAFAEGISHDLLRQIGVANDPATDQAELVIRLAVHGKDLLALHLPRDCLVRALRVVVPPAQTSGPTLVKRSKAFGSSRLPVEAVLGRGLLSLRELDGLALGDVILLDRGPGNGADLRLIDQRAPIARGALDRTGDRPALRF